MRQWATRAWRTRTWRRPRAHARPRPDGRLTDLFAVAAVGSIPLAVVSAQFIPERFTRDSNTLQRIAQGKYLPLEDKSYANIGRLYGYLGMAERPWLAAAVGVAFSVVALWGALRVARGRATPAVYVLVVTYTLLAAVYLSLYSKDVWVLPVVVVVLYAPPGWRGDVLVLLAACTYAYLVRDYWYLTAVIFLGLRLVTATGAGRARVLLSMAAVVVGVTVLAPLALGQDVQSFRQGVNLDRQISGDVNTLIAPLQLGSGPVPDSIENLVSLVELPLPLPLLSSGPLYLVYAVVILVLWGSFARVTMVGPDRLLDGARPLPEDTSLLRCALFALAFLTTQGFFEPDYGSYLRHLAPVVPLLIAVVVGHRATPFVLRDQAPSSAAPA